MGNTNVIFVTYVLIRAHFKEGRASLERVPERTLGTSLYVRRWTIFQKRFLKTTHHFPCKIQLQVQFFC